MAVGNGVAVGVAVSNSVTVAVGVAVSNSVTVAVGEGVGCGIGVSTGSSTFLTLMVTVMEASRRLLLRPDEVLPSETDTMTEYSDLAS